MTECRFEGVNAFIPASHTPRQSPPRSACNPASQIVANTRSNDAYAWTNHYAVNRSYTASGLNQHTAAGGVTPAYDANGNLTAAGGPTYAYNAENRLVTSTGGTYQEMMDDSLDRLFRYYDGSANRWLLYDGRSLIAESTGPLTPWGQRLGPLTPSAPTTSAQNALRSRASFPPRSAAFPLPS